jgi:hypothetical protein
MRRSTVTAVAAVAITASGVVGTTAAIGAVGGHARSAATAATQARHIADALATTSGRARYDLDTGRLVSAEVCVRGSCVHRQFGAAPTCTAEASTCIGTALVMRRFAHEVTIAAELA